MLRAPILAAFGLLAVSSALPSMVRAQPRARTLQLGVETGVLHGRRALGSEGGSVGAVVAVEQRLTTRTAARVSLGLAETVLTAEAVPSCPVEMLCSSGWSFPLRLGTLELHGLFTPMRGVPVSVIAGGGLALPVGIRRQARVTDHLEHDRALKGIARVGAHVSLGRSARAPRLQLSRGWLSGAFDALDRSDVLGLVFVF